MNMQRLKDRMDDALQELKTLEIAIDDVDSLRCDLFISLVNIQKEVKEELAKEG